MEIQETAAIVFGGASGLGEATARRLTDAGARVTIADLNSDRGEQIAQELNGSFVQTDVTDDAQVRSACESAATTSEDGLRISVCCAGVGNVMKLVGREGPTPIAQIAKMININLIGTINALGQAAWLMKQNAPNAAGERGVCVNTASVAAYEGQIGQVAYAASKGGVVGLTISVARELARDGIRVMTIAPGLFKTPMMTQLPAEAQESLAASVPFPPRLGEPSEYADLVHTIIGNGMLNGEVIRLDGAIRMAPR
jgi:NAD(P)-dependent dehydrogenase (short-subunit alcohol dehydrogenase family)